VFLCTYITPSAEESRKRARALRSGWCSSTVTLKKGRFSSWVIAVVECVELMPGTDSMIEGSVECIGE